MTAAIARIGDPSDHGGTIVTGSGNVKANGIGFARNGDSHSCPIHGITPLTATSMVVKIDGLAAVRVGDYAQCGAQIIKGSPDVTGG